MEFHASEFKLRVKRVTLLCLSFLRERYLVGKNHCNTLCYPEGVDDIPN